jgi:tRNA(Ile)-lysidine synthase
MTGRRRDDMTGVRSGRTDFAIEGRVASYAAARGLLPAGSAILLLLSGGADSMAMLRVLRVVNRRWTLGLTLEALHVDYARRGADSARDRALVAAACAAASAPLQVVESGAPPPGVNFQAWAREVRYAAAARLAEDRHLGLIATAHNRDDQAETVLYRLAKYGGPAGLVGMRPADGRLVRPLLCLGSGEVRDYCRRNGIDFGEDVTNARPTYARNRLRLRVLPELRRVNPRVAETIAATAEIAALEREVVDEAVAAAWSRVTADGTTIDVRRLATEAPALQVLCLRRLLAAAVGDETALQRRLLEGVARLAGSVEGSAAVALPGGWEAARDYERLCVRRRAAAHVCRPLPLAPPGGWRAGAVACADFCSRRFAVALSAGPRPAGDGLPPVVGLRVMPRTVSLRHPLRGERFLPLGAIAPRSLARLLMAAKVPRALRPQAIVLDVDGEPAWLGVRSADGRLNVARVAQSFAVTESTVFTLTVTEEGT